VATITNPERPNWADLLLRRGICHERAKAWAQGEADLSRRSTALFPASEPHVLNYLGYSWIDQGINLDDGMRMIRRAVEQQRPDERLHRRTRSAGPITGSRNYDDSGEAPGACGRAQARRSDHQRTTSAIAYAKSGRTLEAQFQWAHARDLKPEPEDLVKIKAEAGRPGCARRKPRRPTQARRSPTAG
jgi:hypothetical protein